jgi:hypothetical protein
MPRCPQTAVWARKGLSELAAFNSMWATQQRAHTQLVAQSPLSQVCTCSFSTAPQVATHTYWGQQHTTYSAASQQHVPGKPSTFFQLHKQQNALLSVKQTSCRSRNKSPPGHVESAGDTRQPLKRAVEPPLSLASLAVAQLYATCRLEPPDDVTAHELVASCGIMRHNKEGAQCVRSGAVYTHCTAKQHSRQGDQSRSDLCKLHWHNGP